MVANIRGYTPAYKFKLINFDTPRWHTLEYANWQMVDILFASIGIPTIKGEWEHSVIYTIGDRAFDVDTNDIYRCQFTHTSAATGTFAQDRAANPSFWTKQSEGVPVYRGLWQPAVAYVNGDIIRADDYTYYLCTVSHTSSPVFSSDLGFWVVIFDTSEAVASAQASADAAAASESNAADSATSAADSVTNAAASETAAAGSATAAAGSATAAANSASAAGTSATNAANSEVAALASKNAAATSATNAATSATNAANSATAAIVAKITWLGPWSNVTSYIARDAVSDGGSSWIAKTNNTNKQPASNPLDWDLLAQKGDQGAQGIQGIQGPTGPAGSGSGDMLRSNNLSDVTNVVTARFNLGLKGAAILDVGTTAGTVAAGDDARILAVNDKVSRLAGGDTMLGDLTISKDTPALILNRTGTAGAQLQGRKGNLLRWSVILGNGVTESGGNSGSSYTINVFDDAGNAIGAAFNIDRNTFLTTLYGDLLVYKSTPVISLDRADGSSARIYGKKGGLSRWMAVFGNAAAEGGGNTGSDFSLNRFDDAGNQISGAVINIPRNTGLMEVLADPQTNLGVATKQYADGVAVANANNRVAKAGDTMTGTLNGFANTGGSIAALGASAGAFESRGNNTSAAVITFHRVGVFATYLGIDTDNALKIGGWSNAGLSYKIYHEGIDLSIPPDKAIIMNANAGGQSVFYGMKGGQARWAILPADASAESGGNSGSNFAILRYNDAGSYIDTAFGIIRNDASVTGSIFATAAQYLANTPNKVLTTDKVWAAAAAASPAVAATITPDFGSALDFIYTLNQAGHTMANPTGVKAGQKGIFWLIQDATGNRTITSWGTAFRFPGGIKPTLSTAPNAVDAFSYVAAGPTNIYCTFNADFK